MHSVPALLQPDYFVLLARLELQSPPVLTFWCISSASLSYTLYFESTQLDSFLLKPEPVVSMASPKIILYQPNAVVRLQRIDKREWDRRRPPP